MTEMTDRKLYRRPTPFPSTRPEKGQAKIVDAKNNGTTSQDLRAIHTASSHDGEQSGAQPEEREKGRGATKRRWITDRLSRKGSQRAEEEEKWDEGAGEEDRNGSLDENGEEDEEGWEFVGRKGCGIG